MTERKYTNRRYLDALEKRAPGLACCRIQA